VFNLRTLTGLHRLRNELKKNGKSKQGYFQLSKLCRCSVKRTERAEKRRIFSGAEMKKKKEFWETKNPNKKSTPLTPSQKKNAMARAKKAGRPYPNLVDNAWAKGKK
jgi:hypothetical protein